MLNGERVLAIIPARGGSKRIPRKNIRPFKGEPLIAWSIYAAQDSKYIDRIVVSSDDQEILDVAKKLGAHVIVRPHELATDTAASEDVIRHVLTLLPDYFWVVLLQPTSPLRTAADIDASLDEMIRRFRNTNACISVGEDGKTNGAVYIGTSGWFERGNNFNSGMWLAKYAMPPERSLDIDTEDQWHD